jgi:hypothetical protein
MAVYSLLFVHAIVPHDHCVQIACSEVVVCVHDGEHGHGEARSHDAPHCCHDMAQYVGNNILADRSPVGQPVFFLFLFFGQVQIFDFSPAVCNLKRQDFYFTPLKIPNQLVEAVPLRAPPIA